MIKRKKSIVGFLIAALSINMSGAIIEKVYAGGYSSLSIVSNYGEMRQAKDSNGITWGYYKYNDGTICIHGADKLPSTIEVPGKLDGYTVTGIDKLINDQDRADPSYGKGAKIVQKIILPSGIKVIGRNVFSPCSNLTDIQMPESVNIIGSYAFNDTWLNAHRDSNGYVIINGILIDGHKSSGNVTIPSNVRCIADGAFFMCDNITSIIIPSSVQRIGMEAFFRCSNLTNAEIAEGVKVVGDKAFAECFKLTEAKLPQSIEELGADTFYSDSALTSTTTNGDGLIISNGVLLSGKDAHGDVSIPSNVTKIQENAFYGNQNVTSVKIPASVTEIGKKAFCTSSIQNVTIPGSVKNIPDNAFDHCLKLTNVKIESGVESIGAEAFATSKISEINIPDSVTNIGYAAFRGCESLSKVKYKSGTTIGIGAFEATSWLDSQSTDGNFTILDGVLLKCNRNMSGEVVIPDNIKEIGSGAFWGNEKITSVKFPKGVTIIDKEAFAYCSNIDKVIFPSTLEKIDSTAFIACSKLKNVELPNSLKTIGSEAFEYCGLTEVNIPNSVVTIGERAFYCCLDLSKVYIPASVKTIGKEAFTSAADTFTGEGAEFAKSVLANGSVSTDNKSNNSNVQGSESNNVETTNKIKPGWSFISNNWYYGNSDGTKKTGWFYDNGNWYYFYGNGQMATGFINLGADYYYYLDESSTSNIGIMKTGWQKIQGEWFYFNTSSDSGITGMMKKGWQYIGGRWYYFYYGDGIMAHDAWIDGYYVNSNGVWVK